MMKSPKDKSNVENAEARVRYLEEVNRSTLSALDQIVELGRHLLTIHIDKDPASVFDEARLHLKRLMSFQALAFLDVDSMDFDFRMRLCDPTSARAALKEEIDESVAGGTFSWALRQNHAVIVPAKRFTEGTLVLHPLATKLQVIGMFVGILQGTGLSIEDISPDLLSIILFSCAQAFENSTLYKKAEKRSEELAIANRKLRREIAERKMAQQALQLARDELEIIVGQRTAELAKTNQTLKAEVEERKRAEEKKAQLLEQVEGANEELKNFAYVVSHDLKAPLRGISSLTDWIVADHRDHLGEEGEKQLDMLTTRVQRMHNLIDGILQYSRVGRINEDKVEVDLNHLVRDVVDMIDPPENINVEIKRELPTVLFEKTRIGQVFQNLIGNAVKYMDKPKGEVTVDCVAKNGYWRFSVADNGPGIDEKHFTRIFQIFQTLAPRDQYESTGIGLTLVKKIVETNGGKVWVESEVGKGSTFFLELPR